jgi:hypothetical protein
VIKNFDDQWFPFKDSRVATRGLPCRTSRKKALTNKPFEEPMSRKASSTELPACRFRHSSSRNYNRFQQTVSCADFIAQDV